MKRVLDLSPERLAKIESVDPEVVKLARAGSLGDTLEFWETLTEDLVPQLVNAVVTATGSPDVSSDAATNYRMVDYYARPASSTPPRCGAHRDFGSFTLVFTGGPGLEVHTDGAWCPVGSAPPGSALLLLGWCTQIRSNGRIPAALHRVVDCPPGQDGMVPRRTSAVLFVAPKDVGTPLEPIVRAGEQRKYISGIKVGMLRGNMGRKWRHREGTLSAEDRVLEEREILASSMKTQDDVVERTVSV